MKPVPWVAFACLATSMALVGVYVGLSRLLVAALPVFLLAWLRFGIAALAMTPWTRRQPSEAPLSPGDRRLLFWESFLGNFGFSICMLFGVAATSAVAAGVVMAAIPATVALMSRVFLGERLSGRVIGAIALAAGGITVLALARSPSGEAHDSSVASAVMAPWWGYVLLFGAVLCESSYVVIGKRLTATVSPRRISALINLWGLALITPFGLWQAWGFPFASVNVGTWGLLVFYALAASVATVWLWMRGLQSVPAAQAGIFTVCLPVSAAAVGVLWLGEPFGPAHGVAFAMALAGLVLATWPDQARVDARPS
ncbi:MAG: DMT family transporter [Betaproteobacteria bacterium]|jgi:drug/metabolite transporter (DMT)-like permease